MLTRKKNIFICTILLFFSSIVPTIAHFEFKIEFRKVAASFDCMDNVSYWQEGYCNKTICKYWYEQALLAEDDKPWLKQYKDLRWKYYGPEITSLPDGLFMTPDKGTEDRFALAFLESSTLEEAFHKLKDELGLEPAELRFLEGFYKRFESRLITLLPEEGSFLPLIEIANKRLLTPQTQNYLDKVSAFYQLQLIRGF